MTDTASPITEPHLSPMFATGVQPALTPNTEPHPSPIFDTGPHPAPLRSAGSEPDDPEPVSAPPSHTPEAYSAEAFSAEPVEWDSDEWEAAAWASAQPDTDAAPTADSEPTADSDAAPSPELEYERAPLWDAGSDSEPELAKIARNLEAAADADAEPPEAHATAPRAFSELENVDTDAFRRTVTGHLQPIAVSAQPIVVPSAYQFVKRWKFALIVAGVWAVAAAAGAGVYYWWYTALDKTLPVFGILLYLVACMVASMLVSMVPNRPQVTALAIALMSAPLASMAAAALLHGAYFFEWITRPTIG